jgi:hypothetical protein
LKPGSTTSTSRSTAPAARAAARIASPASSASKRLVAVNDVQRRNTTPQMVGKILNAQIHRTLDTTKPLIEAIQPAWVRN